MNYYEELGLTTSATEEEIRQAYRNVARLLHPDRQQKPEIRRLAESQMTRLNGIVETLTDPSRRRVYDAQLGGTRGRVSRRSRKRRWWDELLFRRDPATTKRIWAITVVLMTAVILLYFDDDLKAKPAPAAAVLANGSENQQLKRKIADLQRERDRLKQAQDDVRKRLCE